MSRRTVLIVDDEPRAITAMKYVTDWERFGFTVAGEALNGRQAIEMLKKQPYSLLVTDIRMPGLSGIELISEIRAFSPIPIIVMSGHQDFQYAKECLKYGVIDYLLKPVASEDLEALLRVLSVELDQADRNYKRLHISLPIVKEQALKKWARGMQSERDLLDQLDLLGIRSLPTDGYALLIAEMDAVDHLNAYWTESEMLLSRFAVRNVIDDTIGDKGYVFEDEEDRFGIILAGSPASLGTESIRELCEVLISNIEHFTKAGVTVAAGNPVQRIDELSLSYRNAANRLEAKFWHKKKVLVGDSFTGFEQGRMEPVDVEYVLHVLTAVKQKDERLVERLLDQQKGQYIRNRTPRALIQSTVIELLMSLIRLAQESGGNDEEPVIRDWQEYQSILESKTLDVLFDRAGLVCERTIALLRDQRLSQPQRTVRHMKQIAEEQYGEDLSLRSLASVVHLNPVYLGKLFKSVEGISFNDFLLRVRMERAKELLLTTDKKVYEIVREIGYQESDWFYRKFKAYTGYSTKDFKDRYSAKDK